MAPQQWKVLPWSSFQSTQQVLSKTHTREHSRTFGGERASTKAYHARLFRIPGPVVTTTHQGNPRLTSQSTSLHRVQVTWERKLLEVPGLLEAPGTLSGCGSTKVIIRLKLSLLAFWLFLEAPGKLLEALGKLLEAAGTLSGCGSTQVIIRFQLSLLAYRLLLEAPGSSRKLLEAAGSTKVIIRFQLSFLEAPGKLLEAPGSSWKLPGARQL